MPYLHLPRRQFLRSVLAAGVAPAVRSPAVQDKGTRWALLSDTHVPGDPNMIARGFRPYDNAKRAIEEAVRIAPDGIAICGDLARTSGLAADYESLRKLLERVPDDMPVAMAMGNHDDRDNFRKVFSSAPGNAAKVPQRHVLILKSGGIRLVILDSLLFTNKNPGLLGVVQRTWLREYLQNGDGSPVLLFLHHPLADNDGALLDADRFLTLITPFRQVKAVFYGHSHRYGFEQADDIHIVNVPATGYHFDDAQPVGWVEANFNTEGADLKLHAFAGDTTGDASIKSLRWRR